MLNVPITAGQFSGFAVRSGARPDRPSGAGGQGTAFAARGAGKGLNSKPPRNYAASTLLNQKRKILYDVFPSRDVNLIVFNLCSLAKTVCSVYIILFCADIAYVSVDSSQKFVAVFPGPDFAAVCSPARRRDRMAI